MNLSRNIAGVVAKRYATLHELQTVYGSEDLVNLLEILAVDSFNTNAMNAQD